MFVSITFHPARSINAPGSDPVWRSLFLTETEARDDADRFLALYPADTGHTARVEPAAYDDAALYVERSVEAEGEQRAEYGSGAVSLGYDGNEAMAFYDGYRAATDELYVAAEAFLAAERPAPAPVAPIAADLGGDDIPF